MAAIFTIRGGIVATDTFSRDAVVRMLNDAVLDAGADAFTLPSVKWEVLNTQTLRNEPFEGFTTIRVLSGPFKNTEQTRDDSPMDAARAAPTPMVSARRMVATTWTWNVCGGDAGVLRQNLREMTRRWRDQGYLKLPTLVNPYAEAPAMLAGYPNKGSARAACGLTAPAPSGEPAEPIKAGMGKGLAIGGLVLAVMYALGSKRL